MSADERRASERILRRVEELIAALEGLPDPAARAPARELVEVVLELHASALAGLLELVSAAEGGNALIERLAADDRVKGVLLLHGLHPHDFETRVRVAVERLRPHVGVQGVRVVAVDIAQDMVRLRVQISGSAAGRRPPAEQLRREIEDAIFEAAPDVADIRIEGLEESRVVYVPLSSLTRHPPVQTDRPAEGTA